MAPDPSRRDPVARAAILSAAFQLCMENGYAKLSIEGIARRARVGKQTVYRWWPTLSAVLLEALQEASRATASAAFPDTGDIRADLRSQLHALVALMNSRAMVPYTSLIGAAQSDPQLSRALYEGIIRPRVADCQERIAKAQAAGQLRSGPDPLLIVELLYAPLYYRLLLRSAEITVDHVDAVIDLVFAGATPRPGETA